jgi:hypothetical protein
VNVLAAAAPADRIRLLIDQPGQQRIGAAQVIVA